MHVLNIGVHFETMSRISAINLLELTAVTVSLNDLVEPVPLTITNHIYIVYKPQNPPTPKRRNSNCSGTCASCTDVDIIIQDNLLTWTQSTFTTNMQYSYKLLSEGCLQS